MTHPPFKSSLTTLTLAAIILTAASCKPNSDPIPGIKNFSTSVTQGSLYVSFVSTNLHLTAGLGFPIPGLEDATFSFGPDLQSNGTAFHFIIGLQSLVDHGKPLPEEGLPDGRPLPDIQGGVLPRWDVEIEGIKFSVYLSNDAFGIFMPLDLTAKGVSLPVMISVSIKDDRGNLLGQGYAIPGTAAGTTSGLLLLLPYLGGQPQSY